MSGIIHFTSGKTLDITEKEFRNIPVHLKNKGIKVHITNTGHIVPLNSMTMEYF